MNRLEILQSLSQETDSKIVLLVMDGLGGLPVDGQTALEAASTPYLDQLAAESSCGLSEPVMMGITPGSGPSHLALFGYNPTECLLGRGILEALGIDVEVGRNDLVARGNFATHQDGIIVDRRAGRIPTNENEQLCKKINAALQQIEDTDIRLFPGKEHRFVVRFRGESLSDQLTDADPQEENKPRTYTQSLSDDADKSGRIVNAFLNRVTKILKDEPKANTALLRGFSKYPSIPTMQELFRLKPAAIASYPMYRGLAKLVGMDILETGQDIKDLFTTLESSYKAYSFFYIHVKPTDSFGEDGNFSGKKEAIEKTDTLIRSVQALSPDVFVVTSDHSTPCILKSHSWHPNPFLLHSRFAQPDRVARFSERDCCQGYLGRFPAVNAISLMLAHAGKLKKFGA